MLDPLYLTLWFKAYSPIALPIYFRKLMSVFPVSKLAPVARFRVVPISWGEPVLLEEDFEADQGLEDLSSLVQEHLHDDCAYQVESQWDLWQWDDGDWSLKPSTVVLDVYGSEFETLTGEHARVDFGSESLYLPESRSDLLRPVQSNIRSLLHLAEDIEQSLPVERRLLSSDSEENLADKLRAILD
jgi:hypothetical protein